MRRSRRSRPDDVLRCAEAANQLQRAFLHELAVGSLDEIDRPHATVADLAKDTPHADAVADREVAAPLTFAACERCPQQLRRERRRLKERRRCRREAQELFDLRPAARIGGAVHVQERRPHAGRERQRRFEKRVDLRPAPSLRHRPAPLRSCAQLFQQPRAGAHPVALHCADRGVEGGSGLLLGQAGEIPALYDAREARVETLERGERLVHRDDQLGLRIDAEVDVVEREPALVAGALLRAVMARVIDQHAAHRPGADGEKMRAVLPGDAGLVRQLQVDLVYQRGGSERVRGPATRELDPGDVAQVIVDEGEEIVVRLAVAGRDAAGATR